MSPLTIYDSRGLPKVPAGLPGPTGPEGPQGPIGPEGAQGVQGATGAGGATGSPGPVGATGAQGDPGPGIAAGGTLDQHLVKASAVDYATKWQTPKRNWYLVGDNSGDSAFVVTTSSYSTAKSPIFTASATGWYRVRIGGNVMIGGGSGAQAHTAIMIDTTAARALRLQVPADGYYALFTIQHVVALNTGQKIAVGYRPSTLGYTVALVNSAGIVPNITVEEIDPPS